VGFKIVSAEAAHSEVFGFEFHNEASEFFLRRTFVQADTKSESE
jgi:hypothetical protein